MIRLILPILILGSFEAATIIRASQPAPLPFHSFINQDWVKEEDPKRFQVKMHTGSDLEIIMQKFPNGFNMFEEENSKIGLGVSGIVGAEFGFD